MDRRQLKTRAALFAALTRLLERQRFSELSVQSLLTEANIGRSTFYAHFSTKEDLLRALCDELLGHIFSPATSTRLHDHTLCNACFGQQVCAAHQTPTLSCALCHILCHLNENHARLALLFSEEGGQLFASAFRRHLAPLFETSEPPTPVAPDAEPPVDFLLHVLSGSFLEMVRWWLRGHRNIRPEALAAWFVATCAPPHLRTLTLAHPAPHTPETRGRSY